MAESTNIQCQLEEHTQSKASQEESQLNQKGKLFRYKNSKMKIETNFSSTRSKSNQISQEKVPTKTQVTFMSKDKENPLQMKLRFLELIDFIKNNMIERSEYQEQSEYSESPVDIPNTQQQQQQQQQHTAASNLTPNHRRATTSGNLLTGQFHSNLKVLSQPSKHQLFQLHQLHEPIQGMDVMRNFDFYFPYNNFEYLKKFLSLKRKQIIPGTTCFFPQQKLSGKISLKGTPQLSHRGNANIMKHTSTIQKVAMKYQKENEELESLQAIEFSKRVFQESSRFRNIFDSQQFLPESSFKMSQTSNHFLTQQKILIDSEHSHQFNLQNLSELKMNHSVPNQHPNQITEKAKSHTQRMRTKGNNRTDSPEFQLPREDLSPQTLRTSFVATQTVHTGRPVFASDLSIGVIEDDSSQQDHSSLHINDLKVSLSNLGERSQFQFQ